MFLHLLHPLQYPFPVFPEQFHPLLQRVVAFMSQLDKAGDFLDGHTGVFQAADEAQPFQVFIRILAEPALGAFHTGEQSLFFIIPERMRGQPGFFAYFLNRIHGEPPSINLD